MSFTTRPELAGGFGMVASTHWLASGAGMAVLERIANSEGVGCVRLDGEVWTARAYMDDETYEAGTRVQVVEIRGATALVTE